MNLLAVDATGDALSVAVERKGKVYRVSRRAAAGHEDHLWPAVDAALKKAKLALKDLNAVVAASGPGRFTGIRIGLSFASTLGYALKIPAVAISRLEAEAERREGAVVTGVLPGWKGEVYHQRFRRAKDGALKAAGKAEWTAPEAWTGQKDLRETTAEDLLPAARRALKARRFPPFEPFYLKPAGYEKNRR
ncbi:MAG: tRNA (adenosine(37)-N6)-threonylcarbamoyltransferase complex dimerization subunit type 1 TsaB [Elusimicrobiota bacterium]|nr:tRNA (adenosine(37)-N6)-threonylcarbamoyltransferase complex dimerization subunit type 1 TsaB [Elusimicrobiota bacterium]